MKRFQNPGRVRGFLSTFESINAILRLGFPLLSNACHRHRLIRNPLRECRLHRIIQWTMLVIEINLATNEYEYEVVRYALPQT